MILMNRILNCIYTSCLLYICWRGERGKRLKLSAGQRAAIANDSIKEIGRIFQLRLLSMTAIARGYGNLVHSA